MNRRKVLLNLDYSSVMYPDDKKTIKWLNSLRVPYVSRWDFIRQIAKHPLDHTLKEWYNIFKAGVDYYTFQDFLRTTTGKYREAYNEVENQGEGINITKHSFPQIYQNLVDCCEILNIKEIPGYSTDWYYGPYHYSNGEIHRRIIMTSGSIDLFSDMEMTFVLGHELGHMACGHKPYHMLLETFYLPFMNDTAFKAWASIIKMPLLEWYRISDFTADRVGLLCCQDIKAALSTMVKKAGLPKKCYNNINIESFLKQYKEFEEKYTNVSDVIIKNLSLRSSEFPWLVVRAGKLFEWYESEEYKHIIESN